MTTTTPTPMTTTTPMTTNHTNDHTHDATQDGRYGRHGPNDVTRRLGLGVFFFLIYSFFY